jgi:hypothetical protein
MTTTTINLEDRMSEGGVACVCQYAADIGIGVLKWIPTEKRTKTDRQTSHDKQPKLLP